MPHYATRVSFHKTYMVDNLDSHLVSIDNLNKNIANASKKIILKYSKDSGRGLKVRRFTSLYKN